MGYADRGWRVFPLKPGTKVPLLPDSWPQIATTELLQIALWWAQYPDANIAGIPPSDQLVVDVDRKPGKPNGFQTLNGVHWPHAPLQLTPHDGWHVVFKRPPYKLQELPGVNIQQGNKYIVMAPSVVDGKEYQWHSGWGLDAPIREMPYEFLAKFKRAPESSVADVDQPLPLPPEETPVLPLEQLKPAHQTFLSNGTFTGFASRSEVIHSLATRLYQLGWKDEQVLSGLWNHPMVQDTAKAHRQGSYEGGQAYIWDSCKKVRHHKRLGLETFKAIPGAQPLELPQHTQWMKEQLAKRRAARGTVAPAPQGEFTSFADMDLEAGPDWLIDGLIPEEGIGQLFGDYSQGKSFIALDMACSVVTGRPFAGLEVSEPGLAVYLGGEGEQALKYRIEAWRRHHRVEKEALRPLALHGQLNFMDKGTGVDPLIDRIDLAAFRAGRPPSIIFVDTQSTFLGGSDSDEKLMVPFLGRMRELSRYYGCVVVSVAHVGLADKERVRGSSTQGGNIDFSYLVTEVSGREALEEKVTELKVSKPYKDGEPAKLIAFQWIRVEFTDLPPYRNGRARDSLVFTHIPGHKPKDKSKSQKATQQRTIRKLRELSTRFAQEAVSRSLLRQALKDEEKVGDSFLNGLTRHLHTLAENGDILIEGDMIRLRGFAPVISQGFQSA